MDSKFRKNWIDIQNEKVEEQYYRLAVWLLYVFLGLTLALIISLAIIGIRFLINII